MLIISWPQISASVVNILIIVKKPSSCFWAKKIQENCLYRQVDLFFLNLDLKKIENSKNLFSIKQLFNFQKTSRKLIFFSFDFLYLFTTALLLKFGKLSTQTYKSHKINIYVKSFPMMFKCVYEFLREWKLCEYTIKKIVSASELFFIYKAYLAEK